MALPVLFILNTPSVSAGLCRSFIRSIYAMSSVFFFFFQAEDGIRDWSVTGVQTCALPICPRQERLGAQHERERGGQRPEVGPRDRHAANLDQLVAKQARKRVGLGAVA